MESSGSRRPITVTESLGVEPDRVWSVLAAPRHLERFHPFCARNDVERRPGPNAIDEIVYHNGRTVCRRFADWRPGRGFDLTVEDSNGLLADVSWSVVPAPGGCELTIALVPRMLDDRPAPLRWAASVVVRPMLRRYLRSVAAGAEWVVRTGEPVRPNQFGRHPWFS